MRPVLPCVCCAARENGGRDQDNNCLTQRNFSHACQKSTATVLPWRCSETTFKLDLRSFAKYMEKADWLVNTGVTPRRPKVPAGDSQQRTCPDKQKHNTDGYNNHRTRFRANGALTGRGETCLPNGCWADVCTWSPNSLLLISEKQSDPQLCRGYERRAWHEASHLIHKNNG